jgi:alkylation response protein AidB-like acyl-CoA dehydrogenase
VLKAALTHQAFYGASECLQVFGGHGYVREWGIEQIVRDARVAMIYEGTNEIQAIDLLLRKVLADGGAALATLLHELDGELDLSRAADAAASSRFAKVNQLTISLIEAAKSDPVLPYAVADDYLRLLALALLGWAWTRIEAATGADAPRWRTPSVLHTRVLPEFDLWIKTLTLQCQASSAKK